MKWNYRRGVDLSNEQLEQQGAQGWELVSVVSAHGVVLDGSDIDGKNNRTRDPRGWATADQAILFYFKKETIAPI
jgi:hypothetical protein